MARDRPGLTFLGIPEHVLTAIGCVIVAAARLESTIRTMAADVGVYPGRQPASALLKDIRRVVNEAGLPPHARLSDETAVTSWTHRAGDVLEHRHIPAHSAPGYRYTGEDWEPALTHLRSRNTEAPDANELMGSAQSVAEVAHEGLDLVGALRRQPREGVFLPNTVVDDRWVPMCNTDIGGADMSRPTAEELDTWWREFGPFPTLGEA